MSSVKATLVLLLASVSIGNTNVVPSSETLAEGVWTKGGDLATATDSNGLATVSSNEVLSAGSHRSNKGQLYDQSTNTWSNTMNMNQVRESVGVVAVGDEGDVLVVGGFDSGFYLKRVELYKRSTGWTVVSPMHVQRSSMGTVQLNDGRVLVCGGYGDGAYVSASCETYNFLTDAWTLNRGSMSTARARFAMTMLTNGSVLAVGGRISGSTIGLRLVEMYNPTDETWTVAAELVEGRSAFGLVTLHSGSVMLFGGSVSSDESVDGCQILDVSRGSWDVASTSLPVAKRSFGMSVLTNGSVIMAGGIPGNYDTYIWTPSDTPTPPPTPPPSPPPSDGSYRCEHDTCVETGAGTGVPRDECEKFCGAGVNLYLCEGGRCVKSDAGVSLSACEAICRPQTPSDMSINGVKRIFVV